MTDQVFLNQFVGRTIKEVDVQQGQTIIHFTDGSALAVHADTKDDRQAAIVLRFEEKAGPTKGKPDSWWEEAGRYNMDQ